MMENTNLKTSRRGFPKNKVNPFLENMPDNNKIVVLPCVYVSPLAAEIMAQLDSAGRTMFVHMCQAMLSLKNQNEIVLHYERLDDSISSISLSSFYRGIKELIEMQFLAESIIPFHYYVNSNLIRIRR